MTIRLNDREYPELPPSIKLYATTLTIELKTAFCVKVSADIADDIRFLPADNKNRVRGIKYKKQ